MSETASGPLRVRSVVGLDSDELRAMIVDGRLQPGARVGQAELAEALGISRGSVREALRRLAGDGMVVFEVNRGFFVADAGLERVLERFEARLLLEPGIARLAAERRNDADLDALRRAVAGERTGAQRGRRGHDASRAFHAALAGATRNDALTPDLRLALDRRRRPAPPCKPGARSPTGRRRTLPSTRSCSEAIEEARRRERGVADARPRGERVAALGGSRRTPAREPTGERVRLVLVLSENWTLTPPRDLRALVRMAAGGRGGGRRRRDALRARRDGPGAERRRPHGQPARLRAARQPGPGDALARLDRPLSAIAAATTTAPPRGGGDHRAAPPSAAAREGARRRSTCSRRAASSSSRP